MCVLSLFSVSLATPERSSHRRCSLKKVLLKFLQNWQENTCRSRPETLLRKRLQHRHIPVTLRNFLRTPFSLLLESPIFGVFLSSNSPDVYLLVFWFTLHLFLFYLSSDNDYTNNFDSYKVCTLCLLIE